MNVWAVGEFVRRLLPRGKIWVDEKSRPSVINQILHNKLEQIYPGCVRDFIHVKDVVAAVELIVSGLEDGVFPGGCFELGTGEGIEIEELVRILAGKCKDVVVPPMADENPVDARRVANLDNALPGFKPWSLMDRIEWSLMDRR